ncbi:hypothetical protein ABT294_25475 [Nonomuraea sp. NPDC000554]|uniref:hypothetical protein n=1 Tax=Nonomuraea sp. NPDC000554 TaxID=3154259 RepID=UPI00331E8D09
MHSETGQGSLEWWMAGAPFPSPTSAQLAEAFKWSEVRQVTKTATVRLFSNSYCVDASLVRGRGIGGQPLALRRILIAVS